MFFIFLFIVVSTIARCHPFPDHIAQHEQDCHDVEAAKFELLQRRTSTKRKNISDGVQLLGCPRVDARTLSANDLKQLREPTILEHTWQLLDSSTWARADFESGGPFGSIRNVSVGYERYGCEPSAVFKGNVMHEVLELHATTGLSLEMCRDGAEAIWASFTRKNGLPDTGYISAFHEAMDPVGRFLTFYQKQQWVPMHTHRDTMYTQVSGRKGWVFGDEGAFPPETKLLTDLYATIKTVSYDIFGRDDVCDVFLRGVVPEAVLERPQLFRACETRPGDVIFWPGICEGQCGWWHSNCGLDDWAAGFSEIGFRPAEQPA